MIITILAEPRSGSTNLANWFLQKEDFTVFYEPLNIGMKQYNQYKGDSSPKLWKYDTKHLLIKEIIGVDTFQLEEIISISDRLIILYRENTKLQEESFQMAVYTGNWDRNWSYSPNKIEAISNVDLEWFSNLKSNFKSEYVDDDSYFRISYEELYYKNGFQRIVDYIDLPEVQNINFPYGTKYRIENRIDKLI
jgi:hypothetical protein